MTQALSTPRNRLLALPAIALVCLMAFALLFRNIEWFGNTKYLSIAISIELVLVCLWKFDKLFFPVTLLCFFCAGTALPFSDASTATRWVFLGVGASTGFILWMKSDRAQHFGVFHLIALFGVLAAVGSASASDMPVIALLKVGSLFLLFLFAATAARVAVGGREKSFLASLVWGCEVIVFVAGICYFLGVDLFGNPNNLGAFIGVVAFPPLLWAALIAETRGARQRHYLALAVCGALLYMSACRAAIVADGVTLLALALASRRPQLLLKAAFVAMLLLEVVAVVNPSRMSQFTESMTGRLVYKIQNPSSGHGFFASRKGPWDDTLASIKAHPLLGTGFGTSDMGEDHPKKEEASTYTVAGSNREHGSSYLALLEYMGLLGILPFAFLLVLLTRTIVRMLGWMRRTRNPCHYGIPFALIALSGLTHAIFEDWLFAAGSYLCLMFWVSAFLLVDLAPKSRNPAGLVSAPSHTAQNMRAGLPVRG